MPSPRKSPPKKKPGVFESCAISLGPDEQRIVHQRAITMRLRRAEGQIRGVLRMMDAGEPCRDIAQQLAAARQALDRAFFDMMACSLETEIFDAAGSTERQERVSEILRVLSKYA